MKLLATEEYQRLVAIANKYQFLRDDRRADVRIVGIGKRSGDELDKAIEQCLQK